MRSTVARSPSHGGSEPATPGYCCDYDADTLRRGLATAVRGRAPERRDQLSERLMAFRECPNPR